MELRLGRLLPTRGAGSWLRLFVPKHPYDPTSTFFVQSKAEPQGKRDYPARTRSRERAEAQARLVGNALLPDLREERIQEYIHNRLEEGVCGRTINMELGELSRAMKQKWSVLWPRVRKLEESKDVGHALSSEEEERLLGALSKMRSPIIGFFVRESLLTGMRSGELQTLTWGQVDFESRVITVGKAKTSAGTGRQIVYPDFCFGVPKDSPKVSFSNRRAR